MAEPHKDEAPRRQLPWDQGVAEPLPPEANFAAQELWAWARIIRGETADMRFFPKDDAAAQKAGANGANDGAGDDPKAAVNWPGHRDLSARFLRTILFCEPWASACARPFVRIFHARFPDDLDWENETFAGEIQLENCLFIKEVKWSSLDVGRDLGAEGSRFAGKFWGEKLDVGGSLFLRRTSFKHDVSLIGAKIGTSLYLDGASLEGALRAAVLVAEGGLYCREGFSAKGDISLYGARVGGDVALVSAMLEGTLSADRLAVEGDLYCGGGFSAKGEISLLGARVGGNADFVGAGTLQGTLQASGLVVEGYCFLRGMKKLSAANLLGARVGQDLQLSRSAVEGEVNLTGAEIKGELNLAQFEGGKPTWGERARLVLRNAKAGALAGGLDAFRRGKKDFVPCDLSGFAYERIGGIGAGKEGSTLASAKGRHLRAWLKQCRARDHYDPAPYRALAKALAEAGRADRAADVRNALGNYELVAKGTPLMKRFMLVLSWFFIGYGERNHRALIAFALLVLAAAGVGYWQDVLWLPAANPAGWTDAQSWRDWGGFAFGDAIPLLSFDEAHKTFLADRFANNVPTGLTGFFYGVKVAGFVILSYLAAGLSGLAQRRD